MERNFLVSIAFSLAVAGLILNACSIAPKPKPTVQMSTPFNEADFAPYAKKGTGVISGQVFSKTVGGDVKYGAGSTVYLYPKTPYIVEYFAQATSGKNVENIDPRAGKSGKTTTCDGQGNYEFKELPPGDYILISSVFWGVPTRYGISNTGGEIRKDVTVRDGEYLKVMLTP